MTDSDWAARRFEEHRGHLRAVAYRMLGSLSEADDAVQEAWLRFSRSETDDVENLRAWLTTVVARVCLNMLRSRKVRREEALPDPVVSPLSGVDPDPEQQALLADSLGLALLIVLDALDPDERLAFVLHDMFGVPFDEIAPIVGKTSVAARQLASRARRRVRQVDPQPEADLSRQREVVDAFLAASRQGDFEALVAVLHPDVVLRADWGALPISASRRVRGAREVASQAVMFANVARYAYPALVNGAAGLVTVRNGQILSVLAFTIKAGKVVELDIIADPQRLSRLQVQRGVGT